MKDDQSRSGILVTKVFPREALNSKALIVNSDDGRTVLLVKPEYASIAYFAIREAVIYWFETRKLLKRREDESKESEKIFRTLIAWIDGDEFEEIIRHLESARYAAEDTRRQLVCMRNYINTHIDNANNSTDSIIQNLIHATREGCNHR